MNITQKHIDSVINDSILGYFDTELKQVTRLSEFISLRDSCRQQLDGLRLLFSPLSQKIADQILKAKAYITSQKFHSGDACLHPVQSPDVVGQGGTISCRSCEGSGVDWFDKAPCDDCSGTGRRVFAYDYVVYGDSKNTETAYPPKFLTD